MVTTAVMSNTGECASRCITSKGSLREAAKTNMDGCQLRHRTPQGVTVSSRAPATTGKCASRYCSSVDSLREAAKTNIYRTSADAQDTAGGAGQQQVSRDDGEVRQQVLHQRGEAAAKEWRPADAKDRDEYKATTAVTATVASAPAGT